MNASRLKELRTHLGLTQTAFCSQIHINKGNYSKMESGKRSITSLAENRVLLTFDVNVKWWREGKGPVLTESALSFPVHNRNRMKGKPLNLEVIQYDKIIAHTGFDHGPLKKGAFLAIRKFDAVLLTNEAFVVISHSKGVFVGKFVLVDPDTIYLSDYKDRPVLIQLSNIKIVYKIVGIITRI